MLKNIMLPQGLNRSTEISLKSLRLDINIVNHLTTLTIDQDFFNSGSNPIECEYTFPVLKNSVVTALNILLPDGSVLNSHIEEEQRPWKPTKMPCRKAMPLHWGKARILILWWST